jgi:ATP-binding cassette, subfamily B, bacterial PglK
VSFKLSLKLFEQHERIEALYTLFIVIILALIDILTIASIGPLLAVIGDPDLIFNNQYFSASYTFLKQFSITTPNTFVIFLACFSFLLILISSVFRLYAQFKINNFLEYRRHTIALRLLKNYILKPYSFFLDSNSSELSESVLAEVDMLIQNVFRPVFNMLAYAFILLLVVLFLLILNPLIAISSAGFLGLLYLFVFISFRKKLKSVGDIRLKANKDRFLSTAEIFSSIKIVKATNSQELYLSKFDKASQKYATSHSTFLTLSQFPNIFVEVIIIGTILLFTLVLIFQEGEISNGSLGRVFPLLGLYAFSAFKMKPALNFVYQGLIGLKYGRSVIEKIYNDLNYPTAKNEIEVQNDKVFEFDSNSGVVFENVSFRYNNSSENAVSNISLIISTNSKIGIVGGTGAGKTTFVNLLLGLLEPSHGSIKINGQKINANEVKNVAGELVGYVPQETVLLDATIKENIAFGVEKDKIDIEKIIFCSKIAQIHDFIFDELIDGYDHIVGEGGAKLSGGQRQRIGIARALYRDSKILVFDEATSALDNFTEKKLLESINALNDRTLIMVAHRIETIKNCDVILVFKDGQIESFGSFNELLSFSATFKMLTEMIDT